MVRSYCGSQGQWTKDRDGLSVRTAVCRPLAGSRLEGRSSASSSSCCNGLPTGCRPGRAAGVAVEAPHTATISCTSRVTAFCHACHVVTPRGRRHSGCPGSGLGHGGRGRVGPPTAVCEVVVPVRSIVTGGGCPTAARRNTRARPGWPGSGAPRSTIRVERKLANLVAQPTSRGSRIRTPTD